MPRSRMPTTYEDGVPYYWLWETSGELAGAVTAYLEGRETPAQLALVLDYITYWTNAPCWRGPALPELRRRLRAVTTREALRRWLEEALDAGIDPL
jgi:hypothetical protein